MYNHWKPKLLSSAMNRRGVPTNISAMNRRSCIMNPTKVVQIAPTVWPGKSLSQGSRLSPLPWRWNNQNKYVHVGVLGLAPCHTKIQNEAGTWLSVLKPLPFQWPSFVGSGQSLEAWSPCMNKHSYEGSPARINIVMEVLHLCRCLTHTHTRARPTLFTHTHTTWSHTHNSFTSLFCILGFTRHKVPCTTSFFTNSVLESLTVLNVYSFLITRRSLDWTLRLHPETRRKFLKTLKIENAEKTRENFEKVAAVAEQTQETQRKSPKTLTKSLKTFKSRKCWLRKPPKMTRKCPKTLKS